MIYSCALPPEVHRPLVDHLDRADGQEDLCFALYRLSRGSERTTALIGEPILPGEGDRQVHGNVSFNPEYFLHALDRAEDEDAGLAFLHSHPGAVDWQGMSTDDIAAEAGYAAQTQAVLGRPLVGLTLATGDEAWSARFWPRLGRDAPVRRDCETVRLVGEQMRVTYQPELRPVPPMSGKLMRTYASWGKRVQADLTRFRIGVIGVGSVGSMVAETLARIGIEQLVLIDFDSVKTHNLDRLLHATETDVRLARSKVETLRSALLLSATAARARVDALEYSVVEEPGWSRALDCDVLFSCVDRPWPRAMLNLAAYGHLIPVVDGGILVRVREDGGMLSADWKTHVAAPGRRCLECLKQYEPGHVGVERDGLLDDPSYVEGLPLDHPLRANANVFPFSMSAAAFEVLHLISMVAAPNGVSDLGGLTYHAVPGMLRTDDHACEPTCVFSTQFLGAGDSATALVGHHQAAERERADRARRARSPSVRVRRAVSSFGRRLSTF